MLKRKLTTSISLVFLALIYSSCLHAQCAAGNINTAVPASAPLSEFAEQEDGTLRHQRTGLIWQRCALGQNWDGNACTGIETQLNWSSALSAADSHIQAEQDDWRVPNRNELASIIEQRCFSPALDNDAFPLAPVTIYWSSTPVSGGGEQVWSVDVMDGIVVPATTETLQAVRLVRGRC